jgi:PAS domain S-box-containing protein
MQAMLPSNETERVKAVERYENLHVLPTHDLEDITRLVAQICQTPIALVTFIGTERQWFKAQVGLTAAPIAREIAFCAHTILQPDLLIVRDAHTDERFATNPLVMQAPHIRFYAGAPLITSDGYALGTLCVLDYVPRDLTPDQQQALRTLSRQVTAQLELRLHNAVRHPATMPLAKSRTRLHDLEENVNIIPWEGDPVTRRFTYIGPQANALGYPIETWHRVGFLVDHIYPADRAQVVQFVRAQSAQSDNYEVEYRMVIADGHLVWVRNIVNVMRDENNQCLLRGFIVNVTERKRAEEELSSIHDLYRRAIAAVDAVPYQQEYATDSFVFMGESIEQITGYSATEMTPKLLDEISLETIMRGETEGLSEEEAIRRTRLGEFHQWRCDSRILTRSGEERWIADASVEIYDEQGIPFGSIGIMMDITDRKQVEMELQKSNRRLAEALRELQHTQQQLIQQERLRAVGTMASGIAHDFNNMLAPILGFTELLLLRPEHQIGQEKVIHYLQTIHSAAQSAATVVSRLREFYRYRNEVEPQLPVDLHQVVEQAILLTQPHWKDQSLARGVPIWVETELQPVPIIMGNKAELQEMLTNLILNAVDALIVGGRIKIRIFAEPEPSSRNLAAPHIVLEVSDTGMGMDDATMQRCFEPFFSTKGTRGTGLGLAAVYGTVQRHHANIKVESAVGKGTTFRIRLPIPRQMPVSAQKTAQPPGRSLHILVVDDDPTVREVVVDYLQLGTHSAETATNGFEGLEKFHAGQFDLVITDRAMPKLNGDGLAAAIKATMSDTPVILLTGFGDFMNAANELPSGVNRVISKPLSFDTLQKTIADVMG